MAGHLGTNQSVVGEGKLIAYNLEDCAALELITVPLHKPADKISGQVRKRPQSLEIVVADNLNSKVSLWPRFKSSSMASNLSIRLPRWDYQRDSIYIRSDSS